MSFAFMAPMGAPAAKVLRCVDVMEVREPGFVVLRQKKPPLGGFFLGLDFWEQRLRQVQAGHRTRGLSVGLSGKLPPHRLEGRTHRLDPAGKVIDDKVFVLHLVDAVGPVKDFVEVKHHPLGFW